MLLTPSDAGHLVAAIRAACVSGVKYTVIGKGSNLLFSDNGYSGAIISTSGLKSITVEKNILSADAGAPLGAMAMAAARAGLSGLEFSYGIPGSCGGGVFMNAGAYGSQISDTLHSAVIYNAADCSAAVMGASELSLGYRKSLLMDDGRLTVLSAKFVLTPGVREEVEARMREMLGRRRDKQPLEFPSAGSVFKRREGYFMGRIIEESGLKGYRIGGAEVSVKHAGFIVNTGSATAADVLSLIEHIKGVILKNYGFEPECEIRYLDA